MNFDIAKQQITSPYLDQIRQPVHGESKEIAALQAADLLAYEVRKEVLNRTKPRPVSIALERLVQGIPHVAWCLHFSSAEEYNKRVENGQVPNPEASILFGSKRPIRASGNWQIP